jgi:2-oxoglutarate ferredoxin oxidoreductase subunit beta
VFVAGIGCSSRFPYYVNTYGFHTIHGRAPAVATGLKCANPELSVWVVTGDGDGLSIGGNHLLHAMRRNIDLNILLFNNRIYGLTKGQYSPTSEFGKRTKSSPMGAIDQPINPIRIALAAEATFVARTTDVDQKHLQTILRRAHAHKGVSFIEILQNCHVFNDKTFQSVTDKDVRDDNRVILQHGAPLIFGKDRNRGIRLNGLDPEMVTIGEDGVKESDLLVHDEHSRSAGFANILCEMDREGLPTPFGVFRAVARPSYEDLLHAQVATARSARSADDDALQRVLDGGATWEVK